MDIVLKTEFTGDDIDAVRRGLIDFNREASGRVAGYHPFVFHVIDEYGNVAGGATGHGSFDWVFVELLYLPESLRGQGHDRRLMEEIERFGRARGMIGIWLDTFDFQARGFYEKLGFELFGTIEDHPVGGARYFMQKRFVAPTA